MTITYLFRSPGTGYSIEALFANFQKAITNQYPVSVSAVRLPFISRGLRSVWRNLRFVAALRADVFHITGDIHYVALAIPPTRIVLTIHDCITLVTNRKRPLRYAFFWFFWYYLPVRRAAVLTVVSEKTRQELIQYVGPIAKKAVVVPNAYDPAFVYQPMPTPDERPVLLQVGTAPHKNLSNLMAAIDGIDCVLVLVGRLTKAIINDLKRRGITYQHYVGLSRDEVIQLYRNCDIVTFVSTYEGFGMPILEANALGRPVITSDLSPMRDVAADAAHLIDPADVTAIRQGILRLIHDTTYRQALIDAGLKNAQRYSVATVASQYVAMYQQVGSVAHSVSFLP
ncbi:glycosyltransferase family 4 protein [Spirosoma sp.]|uniref:glycosyltransferase family 4 protein n=1 Tax=Spirosoma sp. TaxID=1899569 RepID=UPI003B3B5168